MPSVDFFAGSGFALGVVQLFPSPPRHHVHTVRPVPHPRYKPQLDAQPRPLQQSSSRLEALEPLILVPGCHYDHGVGIQLAELLGVQNTWRVGNGGETLILPR